MITWENYEEYVVMYADKELQPEDEHALMTFIASNPELKAELEAYETLRMTPDETIVYDDKELLTQPVPPKPLIIFPRLVQYAAAAALAALFVVSLGKYSEVTNDDIVVISTSNDQQGIAVSSTNAQPRALDTVSKAITVANDSEKNNAIASHTISPEKVSAQVKRVSVKAAHKIIDIPFDNTMVDSYGRTQLSIKELPGMDMKTSPIEVSRAREIDISAPVALTGPAEANTDNKDFLNNLHLDEANREQVKTIKKVFRGAYSHVKGITIKVKDESLAVIF